MALDLSKLDVRNTAQARRTTNRDSIVPDRRLTDAPDFRPAASMRDASRGDGGAAELMRVLGGVTKAAGAVADSSAEAYAYNQAERGKQNAQQAQSDILAGKKDEALFEKSRAYARAFQFEEAKNLVTKTETSIGTDLDALLNDPNNPADLDDVHQFLEDRFKSLVVGEDGKVRNYGSTEANGVVLNGLRELRQKVMDQAVKVITDQQHQKFIGTLTENAKADFASGKLDFEGTLARRLPGMDLNETRQALVEGLTEDAMERKDVKALDSLMGSKRPDGQSSLNPDQLRFLRANREKLEDDIERDRVKAEKETWEKNSDVFLDRLNGVGSYPTKSELLAARKKGAISAEFLTTSLNMIDADVAHADALAARADARQQRAWEKQAGATGDSLVSRYARGEISFGDAQTQILKDDLAGRYGLGDARRREIGQVRTELAQIKAMRDERLRTPEATEASTKIDLAAEAVSVRLETVLKGPALAAAKLYVKQVANAGNRQFTRKAIDGRDPTELGEQVVRFIGDQVRAKYPKAFRKRAGSTQ